MNDLEQLTLAALLHDIQLAGRLPPPLAELPPLSPACAALLEQAQACATPPGAAASLLDQPLISIFARLSLFQPQPPPPRFYAAAPLPPASAKEMDVLFPSETAQPGGLRPQLDRLADELARVARQVGLQSFERLYTHLSAVLQRHAWCLPVHTPDLPLLDHARLVSALAACLYRCHAQDLTPASIRAGEAEQRFALLVGDLSGIQDYIFDIANIGAGGVARRLRARSFFISALSDVLSHQVVHQFDLPLGNILMSSGGKFYVLLPNLPGLDGQLQRLRQGIDGWLRDEYNGEIALNLAWMELGAADFHAGRFGEVLSTLAQQLKRARHRRAAGVLIHDGRWVEENFVLRRDFWGTGLCLSCSKFPAERDGTLCPQCARDRLAGGRLPNTAYVAYYRSAQKDRGALPMPQGYSVRLLAASELAAAGSPYLLLRLNDPDLSAVSAHPAGFRYLANHVPVAKGEPLTFEDIAQRAEGRSLLGYLKADVDYLGLLFALGLRQDQGGCDTAAHLMALSRELDWFFSGWIQHLLSARPTDQAAGYGDFYTIFSGGDDLFLVGPWDKAADLARLIYARFKDFVAANPDLSLSAGILFTKDRYPIARAAGDAEETLELSKERPRHTPDGPRKRDQLTVLGDTFGWQQAEEIFHEINILKPYSEVLKSAFLYHLIDYWKMYQDWALHGNVGGLRYKPLFAYNIARNLRRDNPLRPWADDLLQSLHAERENERMAHLGLVATYLLFARREKENKHA